MEFLALINWTSPFPLKGLLGGSFHFYSNFGRTLYKSTVETLNQTPQNVVSDLGLCCLSMSHKKDARLIRVNKCMILYSVSLYLKQNIFSPDGCNRCRASWYIGNRPVDCYTGGMLTPDTFLQFYALLFSNHTHVPLRWFVQTFCHQQCYMLH